MNSEVKTLTEKVPKYLPGQNSAQEQEIEEPPPTR